MTSDSYNLLSKIELATSICLSLLAFYLHFQFFYSAGPLWRDEVNSFNLASLQNFTDLWSLIKIDTHPVLFSIVFRGWHLLFGSSDFVARMFGLLVGSLIVLALWANARVFKQTTPVVALSLFAINGMAIKTVDVIRPYGVGILLNLLLFGLVWRLVNAPTLRKTIAATLVATLSVQTLYSNSFQVLAICLAGMLTAVFHFGSKRAVPTLIVGSVAALTLTPYLFNVDDVKSWNIIIASSSSLRTIFEEMISIFSNGQEMILWLWLGLLTATILYRVFQYFMRKDLDRRAQGQFLYVMMSLIVSVVGTLLFLKKAGIEGMTWHYVPMFALVAIATDSMITSENMFWKTSRIAFAIIVVALGLQQSIETLKVRQSNIDNVAQFIADKCGENDFIIVNPFYLGVTFDRYFQSKTAWITIPPVEDVTIQRWDLLKVKMQSEFPMGEVLQKVANTLQRGNNVWIVGTVPLFNSGKYVPPLPPAPNASWGWNYGPYKIGWTMQLAYFIHRHAKKKETIPITVSDEQISALERVNVHILTGWR